MDRAVALAELGPARGPNPRVGCVITSADGRVLAEGYHQGAGTAHAEADAIARATAEGVMLVGATAYVTLEPCSHTGRTGPCVDALAAAGVARVIYAVADPNPLARGGGEVLRERGVAATLVPHRAAALLNRRWLVAVERGRPYVIVKWAQSLDGFTAAADGTSFWITGEEAREHAHATRAEVDAIVIGTGTVAKDDPQLSARPGGTDAPHQPLRVVMGLRDTSGAAVWRDDNAIAARSHDPAAVLNHLWSLDVRTVLIEGGATVASAFLTAGLVDEVNAYIAPVLLGDGTRVVASLGISTMAEALRLSEVEHMSLGPDTLVVAHVPQKE